MPRSTHKLRNLIVASAALAGLAAVAPLPATGPAEAAPNTAKSCLARYHACQQRCAQRYNNYQDCIYRTCNRQHDNCMASVGSTTGNVPRPPAGGPVAKPGRPIGGGTNGPSGGPIVKPSKGGVVTSGGVLKGGVYSPSSGPKSPGGSSSGPILLRSQR